MSNDRHSCPFTPELWDRLMSGTLPPEDRAQLLAHLSRPCPECEDMLLALGVDELEPAIAALWTRRVGVKPPAVELDAETAAAILERILKKTQPGGAMTETKTPNRIAALLAERERIEVELEEALMKPLAVMFTDIKGSTSFFEKRGDLAGLMMVEKHNRMLFPIIESHRGVVVKTIGDAIMVRFQEAVDAAEAAVEMQRALKKYNTAAPRDDAIHVRIGINWGKGMIKDNDVFGDVVNVAARVESCCDPDQILLSEAMYRELAAEHGLQIQPYKREMVRGKSEALEIYRVFWDEAEVFQLLTTEPEDFVAAPETSVPVRGAESAAAVEPEPEKILHFQAALLRDQLQSSLSERRPGEEAAVRESEDRKIQLGEVNELSDNLYNLLKKATVSGEAKTALLAEMKTTGQQLFQRLFPPTFQARLRQSQQEYLIISIDDQLVHIPWELCHDGEKFLCRRFSIGRVVSTHQQVKEENRRRIKPPLSMLALSTGDRRLQGAERESRRMLDQISDLKAPVEVKLSTGRHKAAELIRQLSSYDIIHYSGHSTYNVQEPSSSGWILGDSSLEARAVLDAPGPMPALVFSNSCQSGKTATWRGPADFHRMTFSLANAFLLNGVQHFVGSFHDLSDMSSVNMAAAFYRGLFSGNSIGRSLRQAREKLVEDLGESDLTWASYVLYGDPTTVYLPLQEGTPTRGEFRIQTVTPAPSKKGWIVTAAILAAIVLVLGTLFLQRLASRPDKLNPLVGMVEGGQFSQALVQAQDLAGGKDRQALYLIAVAYHENGNAQAAAEYREKLKALSPDDPGFKILSAEDAMTAGDAEGAKNLLSAALAEPKLWPWQKARALNLRGRIAENEGQAGDARGFYQQALAAEPNSFATLVNLALLAENQGDFQEASSLFARARKLRPNDQMLASIEKDGEDRAAYRQDPANVERVQSLIKELGNITPAAPAANPDLWTSKPLVVAVMGMKSSGGILARGGQAEYLLIKLNEFFQQTPLPVVERKELETLLAEMKLSQTNLADQETAVRIGRLLAARYLVTGDLTYLGNEVEVGLRVVETETGLVTASFSESFDTRKDYLPAVREFVNRIASETVAKLPPRGRVVSVEGDLVVLNIGAKAGVRAGDKFNAFLEAEVKPLMKGDRIAAYLEPSTAAAILEVTAVEPELSRAKVITQTAPPAAGMLVSRQRALP